MSEERTRAQRPLAPAELAGQAPQLFARAPRARAFDLPDEAHEAARRARSLGDFDDTFVPTVDERMLDVYARAKNPDDPIELRDLWLGRVEHELGRHAHRPSLAERWRAATLRRQVHPSEVLTSRATVRFIKELFNWFFRDDLYGELRSDDHIILSSGSVDEQAWGLPEALKDCVRFALERDWYGYSDSCGRRPAREAVAMYENARIDGAVYTADNVALTMGGTFAISALADFILSGAPREGAPVLCGIPNYPPLVESIARRRNVELVPLPSRAGHTSLEPLIAALTPRTPLVLLQTVANPTGAAVSDADLGRLINAASPSTMIVLDECHEWLGPLGRCSQRRAATNVIRVFSASKTWSAPGLKIGWFLADAGFMADYYEYASTTFGGPPSFFYTLVEVLARMERWLITGVTEPGAAEVDEFERSYGLDRAQLSTAYDRYRTERRARQDALQTLRDASIGGLARASARVISPRCSINLAFELPGWNDSYRCFRDLLRQSRVAVFPGILTFCFSGGIVRVTTARQWHDLSSAIARLEAQLGLPRGR
ncbi:MULTISPECIES: pyridoxal phosphate-dependent aminotransferase [Sorangium]|nr:pyridoxal phosphate-dependent aminotransferase [Sorangium cellulosum]